MSCKLCKVSLTDKFAKPQWSTGGRCIAAQKVDRDAWQGDCDANQRVNGVAVERDHHKKDGAKAENNRVDDTELWKWERKHKSNILFRESISMGLFLNDV